MPIRIRYQYPTGSKLGYSIERLERRDASIDFGTADVRRDQPGDADQRRSRRTPGASLGRFKATLASTPAAQFTDGDYAVTIHNTGHEATS